MGDSKTLAIPLHRSVTDGIVCFYSFPAIYTAKLSLAWTDTIANPVNQLAVYAPLL